MSCSPVASKLSDILDILSEKLDKNDICNDIGAVYSPEIERKKQVFTDAVHYCIVLLRQNNRFTSRKSEVLSLEATLMGHEMFERLIGISVQMDVETEAECFAHSEQLQHLVKQEPETDYEETPSSNQLDLQPIIKEEKKDATPPTTPVKRADIEEHSTNISIRSSRSLTPIVKIPREAMQYFLRRSKSVSPQFPASNNGKQLPPSPVSLSGSDYSTDNSYKENPVPRLGSQKVIPLEIKQRVINLARMNPTWTLKTLRKEANVPNLASIKQLRKWEKQVDGGGTKYDKCNTINTLTFERFLAARAKSQPISAEMIRRWAVEGARDLYGAKFKFDATSHWVMNFKKLYNLHWGASSGYIQKNEKKAIQASRMPKKK